ncbi:MAG TPA: hypothetical protein PLK76_04090 [bacterium]|nr:hypothetical protein [bacterium]
MMQNLFILIISLFLIVKGGLLATKYAIKVAQNFRLSKFLVGLIIVSIISILPETFIALNASLAGLPAFGLGTLFGSNVADLTLVFAIIIFLVGRGIKVENKIIKNNRAFPYLFLIPIILGLDGYYSRVEGVILIIAGILFYYFSFRHNAHKKEDTNKHVHLIKNFCWLIFSMAILLVGAHFIVVSASELAKYWGINPILIGMLIVGIGTTIPEMIFALQSVKKNNDSLAVGDILGTVLADATVVVGLIVLVQPFIFPKKIIYVTAGFMLMAAFMLSYFMRTGKKLSHRESLLLFLFWLFFVLTEYLINK